MQTTDRQKWSLRLHSSTRHYLDWYSVTDCFLSHGSGIFRASDWFAADELCRNVLSFQFRLNPPTLRQHVRDCLRRTKFTLDRFHSLFRTSDSTDGTSRNVQGFGPHSSAARQRRALIRSFSRNNPAWRRPNEQSLVGS